MKRPTTPLATTMPMLKSATPALSEPIRKVECTRISQGPAIPRKRCSQNHHFTLPMPRMKPTYLRSGYVNSASIIKPPATAIQ